MSTVGKRYVVEGWNDEGYFDIIVPESILTYVMFGKSVRVFPFRPNWKSPVNEILEWKTDVLRSRDGTEQRRSLRVDPRRGFEYTTMLRADLATALESFLWDWQNKYFAVPVWTDRGKVIGSLVELSESIPVNTATLGFQPGGFALLYLNEMVNEVVEIDAVTPTTLELAGPTEWDWPSGTLIYPLIVGHLNVSVPVVRHTSGVVEALVSFIGTSNTAYPNVTTGSPVTLYDGYEVVTTVPNWNNAVANEFNFQFDTVDAEVGPLGYFNSELIPRIIKPFQWFLKSREHVVAFRSLMARLRGQTKTVWMPSWHDDFEIAAPSSAVASEIIVKGTAFAQLVGVDLNRNRLAIRLPNNTTIYRRILVTAVDFFTDTTRIEFDAPLGVAVQPNGAARARLLLRCRLASDKVVIPWLTDTVAEPQTMFTTVKL